MNLANETKPKTKPQTYAKFEQILGKSKTQNLACFQVHRFTKTQGLSIKIQNAKKFVVAKFLRHHKFTLSKMKLKTLSNHEKNDKRAPQWKNLDFQNPKFGGISASVLFFKKARKSKRFRSHKFGRGIEVSKFLARRKPVGKGKAR